MFDKEGSEGEAGQIKCKVQPQDGDGTVSTKELGAVLRSLGSNPTPEEIDDMIDVRNIIILMSAELNFICQDADADGSGSVDFTEFVELMIKREAEKETPEDLKQAFRVFDKVVLCTLYSCMSVNQQH